MAQNSVITQSALSDIKLILSETAANLSQHINDSISNAHGINILPGAIYTNSNGDILGNYVVAFFVDNAIYYVPANLTTLASQPFTNGAISNSPLNPQTTGSAAWVTNFAAQALIAAENTNAQVLIPHTQAGHWEVHAGMTVAPKETYDSNGHLAARYVIRFQFNQQIYEIPCDTSVTGAPQLLQISLNKTYLYFPQNLGNFNVQYPDGYSIIATAAGGVPPYTFQWYFSSDTHPIPVVLPAGGSQYEPEPGNNELHLTFAISNTSPYTALEFTAVYFYGITDKNIYFYATVTDAASTTVASNIFRIQYHN